MRLTRAHTTRSRTIKKKARDTEKERVREREYECMNRDVALSNRTNVPGREGERHSSFVLFYLPCFRVKMKGFFRGGKRKKSRKRRDLPRVLFPSSFLPFVRHNFQHSQREAVHAS